MDNIYILQMRESSPKYLTNLRLWGSVIHDCHHDKKLGKSNVTVSIDVIELEHKVFQISLEINLYLYLDFSIKTCVIVLR